MPATPVIQSHIPLPNGGLPPLNDNEIYVGDEGTPVNKTLQSDASVDPEGNLLVKGLRGKSITEELPTERDSYFYDMQTGKYRSANVPNGVKVWKGILENPDNQEIFIDGKTGNRYTIAADSTVVFDLFIYAHSNSGVPAQFQLSGRIKNDNGNVAFDGTIEKNSESTVDFDCFVEADNVNKALVIKCTGTGTILWQALGLLSDKDTSYSDYSTGNIENVLESYNNNIDINESTASPFGVVVWKGLLNSETYTDIFIDGIQNSKFRLAPNTAANFNIIVLAKNSSIAAHFKLSGKIIRRSDGTTEFDGFIKKERFASPDFDCTIDCGAETGYLNMKCKGSGTVYFQAVGIISEIKTFIQSIPAAANNSGFVERTFDFNEISTGRLLIGRIPAGRRIPRVICEIISVFNNSTLLTVGDNDGNGRLMAHDQNETTSLGVTINDTEIAYSVDTDVYVYKASGVPTAGQARVVVYYS